MDWAVLAGQAQGQHSRMRLGSENGNSGFHLSGIQWKTFARAVSGPVLMQRGCAEVQVLMVPAVLINGQGAVGQAAHVSATVACVGQADLCRPLSGLCRTRTLVMFGPKVL